MVDPKSERLAVGDGMKREKAVSGAQPCGKEKKPAREIERGCEHCEVLINAMFIWLEKGGEKIKECAGKK